MAKQMNDVRKWVNAAPPVARQWLQSIIVRRFLYDRRTEAFQMQGRYDGAMSKACKELYSNEHDMLDAMIEEIYGEDY